MSLSHKSRTALYQGLTSLIDDEVAVEEMLSSFPTRELDEPVTKDFHRAETALLRAEFHHDMSELRADLRSEMGDLRAELRGEMGDLGTSLRSEMHTGFAELRIEMHRNSMRMVLTLAALMISMTGVIVAALTAGG